MKLLLKCDKCGVEGGPEVVHPCDGDVFDLDLCKKCELNRGLAAVEQEVAAIEGGKPEPVFGAVRLADLNDLVEKYRAELSKLESNP